MIEILLQAERALSMGMLDQAERMYRQAADADPRNSIAVVGLARVALERGDEPAAWRFSKEALEIDPENVAASRLAERLEEVWAYRGASLPDVARAEVAQREGGTVPPGAPSPLEVPSPAEVPSQAGDAPPAEVPVPPPVVSAPAPAAAPQHLGVVDRLFRRNRP